jgi:hypothetical protein
MPHFTVLVAIYMDTCPQTSLTQFFSASALSQDIAINWAKRINASGLQRQKSLRFPDL